MLQNNLRNLFVFCINVDIDEILLLEKHPINIIEKNKGLGVDFFSYFPLFFYMCSTCMVKSALLKVFFLKQSDTLQTYYRQIEQGQEEVATKKIIFDKMTATLT